MAEQDEKAHVHIAVNKSVKEEWQAYLEEPYTEGSLTSLIERAVGQYIQGEDSGNPSRQATETEQTPPQTAEVVNGMARLENLMEDVSDRLSAVEREMGHSENMKADMERVYDVLPPEPFGSTEWRKEKVKPESEHGRHIAWEGTVDDISEEIGIMISTKNARRALKRLKEDTKRVKSETIDGETRYWRNE